MHEPSDTDLLAAWTHGDQRAGSQLYRRHARTVGRFFRNKASPADVSDLVQQTFMTCFERASSLRDSASFRAFALGVARNILFAYYRKRHRRDGKLDFGVSSVVDLGITPTAIIAERQQEGQLLAALRNLSVDQQVLLELYYWEGMRGSELAAFYEVPESTVRTRLRRARLALEQQLGKLQQSPLGATETSLETWAKRVRDQL